MGVQILLPKPRPFELFDAQKEFAKTSCSPDHMLIILMSSIPCILWENSLRKFTGVPQPWQEHPSNTEYSKYYHHVVIVVTVYEKQDTKNNHQQLGKFSSFIAVLTLKQSFVTFNLIVTFQLTSFLQAQVNLRDFSDFSRNHQECFEMFWGPCPWLTKRL